MRLAFIGGWGHHYLRRLLSAEADGVVARPVAVSGDGHDERRARALAQQLGEATWFDDPRRMLEQFRPDVVSVGAVYGYNGDMIALAMERGAAVVSDKPIAATWEQLGRLKQLSARPGATLLTELPLRCLAEFQAAAAAVADGRVGRVVLATAQKSYRFRVRPAWYADRASYGGTMLWVASHGIDAIRFLTGKPFLRVSATQGNVSRAERGSMEEYCIATFDLAGGGAAVVHADYLRPNRLPTHSDDRIRIAGDRGIVEIRDNRCLLTDDDGTREVTA
ncbi:MAG TPA: Gfo/Idh/MocA family oxidoreductase, partial [Phycisphaerae bacterium]|nr:Gfo/Idh/MocA family oxidoreductase [Phycisphaerae bacterium]